VLNDPDALSVAVVDRGIFLQGEVGDPRAKLL
jgi:hypothetical protein